MELASWPQFDQNQIESVVKTLSSGKVNSWIGNETRLFEKEYSELFGTEFSIALANGSLALSSAYRAIGLKEGDEIITTPRTFIATASSAVLMGVKTIFADVDYDSGNITPETVEPLINSRTKAISVVHLGGWPAEMETLSKLAKNNNLFLIEDCSQAHGAKIRKKSVGTFGDIATWSFCQDKIISTGGEGGMITTNSKKYMEKIWSYKDHGKTIKAIEEQKNKVGFKWLHEEFGTNFRMTELQSSIGRAQLKLLPKWSSIRKRNALILKETLQDLNCLRIPLPNEDYEHAWYKFYAFINTKLLKSDWSRNRILEELKLKNTPAFSGSCSEIYLEKCFVNSGIGPKNRLTNAKELGETSLMFLVHPTIEEKQMQRYAQEIKSVISKACL